MSDVSILRKKSDENLDYAKRAEADKTYHIAISRYYYSFYQYMKSVIITNNPNFEFGGEASHFTVMQEFSRIYFLNNKSRTNGCGQNDFVVLGNLNSFKRFRCEADYDPLEIDGIKFNKFFTTYQKCLKLKDGL